MAKTPNLNLNVPDYRDLRWDIPVNENWSLIDAAVAGKQATLTFDTTPINGSTNPVTSGGIYSALLNTGSSLDYTGTTLSLENAQGNVLSSVTIKSTPDLDNTTISLNPSSELQAIGTVNKNTATGATNPKYDWVGTLQEYEDQNVETLHPDWICYITDDVQGGTSVYTKTQVNNLLSAKANSADVYTKTDIYTKAETDTALALKADSANFQVVTALPANPTTGVFYFVVES